MFDNEWLSLLWMLVCIVVVLGLAYWFTRNVLGRGMLNRYGSGQVGRGGKLRALQKLPISRDQQLLVVQMGERVLLLGVTSGGIQTLCELTPEEAKPWLEESDKPQEPLPSFQESLRRVMEQRRKKG
ncbi:MAG: FliO/MopB family protein [Acutalibacter sp.]|jgi:flagellar protein FliO/FliZ